MSITRKLFVVAPLLLALCAIALALRVAYFKDPTIVPPDPGWDNGHPAAGVDLSRFPRLGIVPARFAYEGCAKPPTACSIEHRLSPSQSS